MPSTGTKAAGITLVALLALTACGGGDSEAPEDQPEDNGGGQEQTAEEPEAYVYDFEQAKAGSDAESYHVPGGETVTVQLSNELAAVLPEENSVPVESYTLTARSFEETGVCVLEAEIHYAPGGEQVAEELVSEASEGREGNVFFQSGPNSTRMVEAMPSDDQLEESTLYLLSDLSAFAVVEECSDGPQDGISALKMPERHDGGDRVFAEVEVAVQPDGAITLFDPEVDGAEVSASGDWSYDEPSADSDDGPVDEG